MKKLFLLILTVFCTLAFCACGSNGSNGTPDNLPTDNGSSSGEQGTASGYAVGDIILADGTVVRVNNFSEIDNDNLPIAVIAATNNDNAVGIGIHRSAECLQWETASGEHPAADFVAEYAITYRISGEYASDWRLPEVEELKTIYANRNTINTSLQKIYGFDRNAAMNGLSNVWYWTGTLASKDGFTWFVHFVNGYAGECERDLTNLNVMAVRNF